LTEGLEHLIASDPAKVLEIAGRLPRETENVPSSGMNALERSALNALAERDPAAAMRYLEPILSSIDMNIAVQAAIVRFARTDPDAALAWLSSLGTAKSTYIRVVLRGIAQADFPRAFRAASAEQTSMESFEYALGEGALGDPASAAEAASFLVNDGSAFAAVVLDVLAEYWASRDPNRFTGVVRRALRLRFHVDGAVRRIAFRDARPRLGDAPRREIAARHAKRVDRGSRRVLCVARSARRARLDRAVSWSAVL
jgi:hypothetical protein